MSFQAWCKNNKDTVEGLYNSLDDRFPSDVPAPRRRRCHMCQSEAGRVEHIRDSVLKLTESLNQLRSFRAYRGLETDLKEAAKVIAGGAGPERLGNASYYSPSPVTADGGVGIGSVTGTIHGAVSGMRDLAFEKSPGRGGFLWRRKKQKEEVDVGVLKDRGCSVYNDLVWSFWEVVWKAADDEKFANKIGDGFGGAGLTEHISRELLKTLEHWQPIFREHSAALRQMLRNQSSN